ncbi:MULTISPECIES: recombinase family protein [Serratia]|jgi:hypothetical protein|uniref:recombinase family protein n=1 Tax=Serratia TaxID=613 RepID=UPI0007A05711|nr:MULTISPECIES: recombinase family protein [Serratia]KYQ97316.1 hypothetical protein AWY96_01880 [Serratia plymuthica]
MYQDIRKNKTAVFDNKIKPVLEELIEFGYGYKAIANALNEKGVLNLRGGRWSPDSVRYILSRIGLKTLWRE